MSGGIISGASLFQFTMKQVSNENPHFVRQSGDFTHVEVLWRWCGGGVEVVCCRACRLHCSQQRAELEDHFLLPPSQQNHTKGQKAHLKLFLVLRFGTQNIIL